METPQNRWECVYVSTHVCGVPKRHDPALVIQMNLLNQTAKQWAHLQCEGKEIKESQGRCGLRHCGNQESSDSELRHYCNGR